MAFVIAMALGLPKLNCSNLNEIQTSTAQTPIRLLLTIRTVVYFPNTIRTLRRTRDPAIAMDISGLRFTT